MRKRKRDEWSGSYGPPLNTHFESALRISGVGKRSKQRFLRISCHDSVIKASRRGAGGNTTPYNCFIVKQNQICSATIELLRQGKISLIVTELHVSTSCLTLKFWTATQGTDKQQETDHELEGTQ